MKSKVFIYVSLIFLALNLHAQKVSHEECLEKGDNYIFAGGECIQYFKSKGDRGGYLNIIVHGTWPDGTNTLGRYSTFAETLTLNTDITTVAVALPGYSDSSTNNFTALAHEGVKNLAAKEEYIKFLGELISELKDRFEAKTVTYIGHSAGAMMGATLTGVEPNLINNAILVGGRYDIHQNDKSPGLISIVDVINKVSKKTKFILIYGENDKVSPPEVTKNFYNLAIKKGLDAKIVEVKNGVHLDLDMTDTSLEAITKLLEEE
ncbi:alpha/beta hydrolase [Arcobacter sp. KX21116]|jgi:predicted esterase|uniref:alpha/beta hydrolase n=1 Tax=Arcobacter iocasae TaxID=2906515 RepID=UPI0035D4DB5E|tara:strand:+ start:190 stop:978 length:789 start_codon:yes stop_codon:yes gene_type:complete